MPTLDPSKKSQLIERLEEFASDFAQQPGGVALLAKYIESRELGRGVRDLPNKSLGNSLQGRNPCAQRFAFGFH